MIPPRRLYSVSGVATGVFVVAPVHNDWKHPVAGDGLLLLVWLGHHEQPAVRGVAGVDQLPLADEPRSIVLPGNAAEGLLLRSVEKLSLKCGPRVFGYPQLVDDILRFDAHLINPLAPTLS